MIDFLVLLQSIEWKKLTSAVEKAAFLPSGTPVPPRRCLPRCGCLQVIDSIGGADGDRTRDLLTASSHLPQ